MIYFHGYIRLPDFLFAEVTGRRLQESGNSQILTPPCSECYTTIACLTESIAGIFRQSQNQIRILWPAYSIIQ
jgi:hypothetical protein